MLAVIHRDTPPRGSALLPIAGPPLILRQLQWLRDQGCERVAIDIGLGDQGEAVRRLVAEQEILARGVVFIPSAIPLPPLSLGAKAGFPAEVPLLALSESLIGGADLTRLYHRRPNRGVLLGRLAPLERGRANPPIEVRLLSPFAGPTHVEHLPGWGASIDTPGAAVRLACEALLGRLPWSEGARSPLLIHATEHAEGVWVARGGRIQRGARVYPPVLVGAGAIVWRGARIGPGALIGERAIIEPGALVEHALVESGTVVGEGLVVRGCVATPRGLTPLEGGAPEVVLGDPLLLARRRRALPGLLVRLLRLSC
jgi:hypothetical protein